MTTNLPSFAKNGLSGLGKTVQNRALEKLVKEASGETLKSVITAIENDIQFERTDVFTFEQVDEIYNRGISLEEKQAWVWFKHHIQGVPMQGGWLQYHVPNTEAEIERLVRAGALYFDTDHYAPYPIFKSGFLRDKYHKLQEEETAAWIIKKYGHAVYDDHIEIIKNAMPTYISISDPDPAQRPYITPVSDIAQKKFYIKEVNMDYSNMLEQLGIASKKRKGQSRTTTGQTLGQLFEIYEEGITLTAAFQFYLRTLRDKDFKKDDLRAEDIWMYYIVRSRVSKERIQQRLNIISKGERKQAGSKVSNTGEGKESGDERLARIEIQRDSQEEGDRLFQNFLYEVLTIEDKKRLDQVFNETLNSYAPIDYNRVPIGFEYSANFRGGGFAIRPEKREAIAFAEAAGSGILGYDVGVGKTPSAILELISAMYQGKCKRPLVVVPKPTYKTWIQEAFGGIGDDGREFNGLMANTGYKYQSWHGLNKKLMDELLAKGTLDEAVPEYTVTFVTYEALSQLGFSENANEALLTELVNILYQDQYDEETGHVGEIPSDATDILTFSNPDSDTEMIMFRDSEGASNTKTTRREQTKERQKIEETIGIINEGAMADIDILGFDYLIVDEAHRAKKVFTDVRAEEEESTEGFEVKRYQMNSGSPSKTGLKIFAIANYIQRTFDRNVMLLTATPFTNSPLEIYSMLSMVAMKDLHRMGISNLSAFFKTFIVPKLEMVVKADNTLAPREVVKGFQNPKILQNLIFSKINYKPGEQVGVRRPCKLDLPKINEVAADGTVIPLPDDERTLTYLRMNEWQANNQAQIKKNYGTAEDSGDLLRALNASLNNALSPFLVVTKNIQEQVPEDYREFIMNSPKIEYTVRCVQSVKEWHEQRGEPVSGQVIYANRGKKYFHYIYEWLIKEVGYKDEVYLGKRKMAEVMIVAGSAIGGSYPYDRVDKEEIKEAFQKGIVKVVIGTDTIKEGINLQKTGTVIYNMYPNWNPTDQKQLVGRIHRQKNPFGFVRSVMPLITDTMDVFIFQKLEEKTARINGIFNREGQDNMLSLAEVDPEAMKLALIDDIYVIADMRYNRQRGEDERQANAIREDKRRIEQITRHVYHYKRFRERLIDRYQDYHDALTGFLGHIDEIIKSDQKRERKDRKFTDEVVNDLKAIRTRIKEKDGILERLEKIQSSGFDPQVIKRLVKKANNLKNQNLYKGLFDLTTYTELLNGFENFYSNAAVAEREVLKPHGLNMEDDMDQVKNKLEEKLKDAEAHLAYWYEHKDGYNLADHPFLKLEDFSRLTEDGEISEPNRYVQIAIELRREKERTNVVGESVANRVKEFASTNHLLQWRMTDIDPLNCRIPKADEKPMGPGKSVIQTSAKEKAATKSTSKGKSQSKLKLALAKLKLAKAKAMALALANA